jgi:hypothetical protein
MSVTFVTLALELDARLEPAWARMTAANICPFWSRLTRLATGVFGSKNAVQLAVISATAEPPDAAVGDGEVLVGADVEDELAPEPGVELELEPLLQAAALVVRAHSSITSEIEFRVFTRTFSSFPLALAI